MLGTNAKEREKVILQYLYLNRPVSFTSLHIKDHTDTRVGVAEALEDLRTYQFIEVTKFDEITLIDQMIKATQGAPIHQIKMPEYKITPQGIKYIEITEFNKQKGEA